MRFLCVADIHGARDEVLELREFAQKKKVEHILILGDFPAHGKLRDPKASLEDARFVLEALSGFELFAIPGNCDPKEILDVFDEYSVNLHAKTLTVQDTSLVGFGGSAPTPFNTPFEFGEDFLYSSLDALFSGLVSEKVVLAVHNPPIDTICDLTSSGQHVGSKAIRDIAEKHQPDILLCSHIHEAGGSSDHIGETLVANIGPLRDRRIGVLEIGGDLHLRLGRF